MRKSEINVNAYWDFVRKRYPDARFSRWFEDGELHFYPNGKYEAEDKMLSVCYRDENAQLAIAVGDQWK